MSDKMNPLAQTTPEQALQEWRKLSPKLPPMIRQWIEKTARAMLDSHVPAAQMRPQLERDLQQKSQLQPVLNDPSLTVEDKIQLMLMLIMGKMDADIENQTTLVKAKKATVAPAPHNAGGGIDVETMKLKRMVDKRAQMFDMMRQIIDRHNQTAQNVIRNLGR